MSEADESPARRGSAPTDVPGTARPSPGGLCPACCQVKVLTSDRGSTFYLCRLASSDPGYPRYPAQPRLVCPGFER